MTLIFLLWGILSKNQVCILRGLRAFHLGNPLHFRQLGLCIHNAPSAWYWLGQAPRIIAMLSDTRRCNTAPARRINIVGT